MSRLQFNHRFKQLLKKEIKSRTGVNHFKYIYLLWRQNNLYSYNNYKTCNRKKKKYYTQNWMSYLEISSKTGSEMIIRIQQQFFGDLHFVLQDIKLTMKTFQLYEYWKLLNTQKEKEKKRKESHGELKIICLHGTRLCVSKLSSFPQLGFSSSLFPGMHKGIRVSARRRKRLHVKDGKYVSLKKNVNL